MFGWIKYIFGKNESPHEQLIREISDPKLFTPGQREYLGSIFSPEWTHFTNLDQELLLRVAATMNVFGIAVSTQQQLQTAFLILVRQGILEYNPGNPYVLRRAT